MKLADIHHAQAARTGEPAMTDWQERFWSKVDKTETCWLWTGGRSSSGYGQLRVGGRRGTMRTVHRLSYEVHHGEIPAGMLIDHTCHAKECVNPAHLRAVSNKENQEHRSGPQRNSSSGYLGVHRNHRGPGWRAHVRHDGHLHYAGVFDTPEEANAAAIALRNKLFTHNNLDRPAVTGD